MSWKKLHQRMYQTQLGTTKSGKPVFGTYYHHEHSGLTPEEHSEASKMHFDQAKQHRLGWLRIQKRLRTSPLYNVIGVDSKRSIIPEAGSFAGRAYAKDLAQMRALEREHDHHVMQSALHNETGRRVRVAQHTGDSHTLPTWNDIKDEIETHPVRRQFLFYHQRKLGNEPNPRTVGHHLKPMAQTTALEPFEPGITVKDITPYEHAGRHYGKSEDLDKYVFEENRTDDRPVLHGWIDPKGLFHRLPHSAAHDDWIYKKGIAPGAAHASGWLSVGHGGEHNIGGHSKFLENPTHPATQTARRLAAQYFGPKTLLHFSDQDSGGYSPMPKRGLTEDGALRSVNTRTWARTGGKNQSRFALYRSEQDGIVKIVSIAVLNSHGQLLMGQRNDSHKWTLPGGHAEETDKDLEAAAHRELKEEAGFDVGVLQFLGSEVVVNERGNTIDVHCYKAFTDAVDYPEGDPDEEVAEWKWVDVKDGLPPEIVQNLHNPRNVTLKLLDLCDWDQDINKMQPLLTFPKFGVAKRHYTVGYRDPKFYYAQQKKLTGSDAPVAGAVLTKPSDKRVPWDQRQLTGALITQPPGKRQVEEGTRQHEEQHGIFHSVGEEHGFPVRRRLAMHLVHNIPKQHQDLFHLVADQAPSVRYAHPNLQNEERITFLHSYMGNPTFRKEIHNYWKKEGISPNQIDKAIKSTFHHLRGVAATVSPNDLEELGKAELLEFISSVPQIHDILADETQGEDLVKSLKHALLAGAVAGSLLAPNTQLGPAAYASLPPSVTAPMHAPVRPPKMEVNPHDRFLDAISAVESTGGRFTDHPAMAHGMHKGFAAVGEYGIMPLTAKTIAKRATNPSVRALAALPAHKIAKALHSDPKLVKEVARENAAQLRARFNGDVSKMAYAWFNGPNSISSKTPKQIKGHWYTKRFLSHYAPTPTPTPTQKSENLEKGVMRRIAPFNPEIDVPGDEALVSEWQQDRDPEVRDSIGYMEGPARTRALHKLSAATKTRRNPRTGRREFLLHRGMSREEHNLVVGPSRIGHDSVSSWTPHRGVANSFADRDKNGKKVPVVSAWIDEDAIHHVPNQLGRVGDHPLIEDQHGNFKRPVSLQGPNRFREEFEVIVSPHTSKRAFPSNVRDIHQKINESAKVADDPLLLRSKLRQRVNALKEKEAQKNRPPRPQKPVPKPNPQLSLFDKAEIVPDRQPTAERIIEPATYRSPDEQQDDLLDQAWPGRSGHYFEAAQFLSGKPQVSDQEAQNARSICDDDEMAAALYAYGIPDVPENRDELEAVAKLLSKRPKLHKAEGRPFVKRDLDPQEGISITHEPFNEHLVISAHDRHGNRVGQATIDNSGRKRIRATVVEVHPEHRRKGIATAMYRHAENITGKTLHPSDDRTAMGTAFWRGTRGQGTHGAGPFGWNVKRIRKTEDEQFPHLLPVPGQGEAIVQAVNRGISADNIMFLEKPGKFSKKAFVVLDPESNEKFIVKPNPDRVAPTKGMDQSFGQALRERTFWNLARALGLDRFMPEVGLAVDGQHNLYTVVKFLDGYESISSRKKETPGAERGILESYRQCGDLHKLAVLDFIAGSTDRHGNNIFVDRDCDVQLIDHGSTFANEQFDPFGDKRSFIPYYLRFMGARNDMDRSEFLRHMPAVGDEKDAELATWVLSIHPDDVRRVMVDVPPEIVSAVLKRLERLQAVILANGNNNRASETINRAWVGLTA